MSVTLTPQTEAELQQWIERGDFPDVDTVIQTALLALKEREEAKFQTLRALVHAGFERGNAVELTDELWDELERDAEAAYQRGELPPAHVCP